MNAPQTSRRIDAPAWRRHAPWLVAAYLVLFAALVHWPSFHGLTSPDAMRYADAARNFVQGEGLVGNTVYPRNLADMRFTERLGAEHIRPRDTRYTGYPLALAGLFAVFGARDGVVFGFATALWILGGLFVFGLGRRIFSLEAALLAVLLYSLQAKLVAYAVKGIAEPICIALMLGGGLLILARRYGGAAAVAAGLLGAFSFVVRQPMLFVTPIAFAGFVVLKDKARLRTASLVIVGLAVGILLRSWITPLLFPPHPVYPAERVAVVASVDAAPSPAVAKGALDDVLFRYLNVQVMAFSQRFPGHALERTIRDERAGEETATAIFFAKMKYNLRLTVSILAHKTGAPLWSMFFLAALVLTFRDRSARWLSLMIAALFALTVAAGLALFVMERYFHLYIPLMALVGGQGLVVLGQKLQAHRPAVRGVLLGAIVLAVSLPLPFGHLLPLLPADATMRDAAGTAAANAKAMAIAALVRQHTEADDIVFCDLPWITSWYADRTSIWLPLEPEDVHELARWVAADHLVLTLEVPQGFDTWRAWLIAGRQGELAPEQLADWRLQAGTRFAGRGIYLFERPTK